MESNSTDMKLTTPLIESLRPELLNVGDPVDVLVVAPVALDGVVVGAVGDVEGRVPPVLLPREYLLREGQVHPEGVVGHRAPQHDPDGGKVVGGVVVVVGQHRADRYVAAAGWPFNGQFKLELWHENGSRFHVDFGTCLHCKFMNFS